MLMPLPAGDVIKAPLFMPAVVHLNILMPVVTGDVIPISKVLYHCMVSVKRYRGLVKSGLNPCLIF